MNYSILRKISSGVLALVLILSTISYSVEKHFCEGFLVDTSFFGEGEPCGELESDACGSETLPQEKDCCEDEIHHIEGIDNLVKVEKDNDEVKHVAHTSYLLPALDYSYFEEVVAFIAHEHYSPPELVHNIHVLFEVYIL